MYCTVLVPASADTILPTHPCGIFEGETKSSLVLNCYSRVIGLDWGKGDGTPVRCDVLVFFFLLRLM